jgi:hypothetical protein
MAVKKRTNSENRADEWPVKRSAAEEKKKGLTPNLRGPQKGGKEILRAKIRNGSNERYFRGGYTKRQKDS